MHCIYTTNRITKTGFFFRKFLFFTIFITLQSSNYCSFANDSSNLINIEKKAQVGDSENQYKLANIYDEGKIVKRNPAKVIYWLEESSKNGNADAQLYLGNIYEFGDDGIEIDKTKAFELYKKSSDQGNAEAQWFLANMYSNNEIVPQDHIKAFQLYKKSAEQGYDFAQYNLGKCYEDGLGVVKNELKALDMYEKASSQNNLLALLALAKMYEEGEIVVKDIAKAKKLHEKAQSIDPKIYSILRDIDYFEGYTFQSQKTDSEVINAKNNDFQNHMLRAETGDKESQFKIGSMYEFGIGTQKNQDKALEWYGKAAKQGHALAEIIVQTSASKPIEKHNNSEAFDHW